MLRAMARLYLLAMACVLAAAAEAAAEAPRVVAVEARPAADGWTFTVTVRSDDAGWSQYADGWEVAAPDGARLGRRELLHPHVDEQPFTRSLSGVAIPPGVDEVLVRAHDSREGWGPPFRLALPPGR
jgi:hypothetical protein